MQGRSRQVVHYLQLSPHVIGAAITLRETWASKNQNNKATHKKKARLDDNLAFFDSRFVGPLSPAIAITGTNVPHQISPSNAVHAVYAPIAKMPTT